jgi:hypothetical protein
MTPCSLIDGWKNFSEEHTHLQGNALKILRTPLKILEYGEQISINNLIFSRVSKSMAYI